VGATKVVTDETFETDVLKNDKPVIVDYWAEWCGPCRMVAPVLESIAGDLAGQASLVKINSDENPVTVSRYRVLHVPTICVFSAGEMVKQVVGARSKTALLREFADVLPPSKAAWVES
jgi:thioredoxin 1